MHLVNWLKTAFPVCCAICAVKGTRPGGQMPQPERTVWPAVPGAGEVSTAGLEGGPGRRQPPQQPQPLCSDQRGGPDFRAR